MLLFRRASPLRSKPLNERSYEKVNKVKADVAAVLTSFRTNQVLLKTLVDAIRRCRASIRTLSGPLRVHDPLPLPAESWTFLGYTFRPRRSTNRKGKGFINFSPGVSNRAAKAIRDQFRSWKLPQRSDKAIEDLSRMFNPIIRGWIQYYGRYYRSALYPTMRELDRDLVFWAKQKYKKLRRHLRRATHWIARISRAAPELFAHWQMGARRGSMMGAV